MNYLCFDVGTTCCKYQLFSDSGEILAYESKQYSLKRVDQESYVDIDAIWENIQEMLRKANEVDRFASVCISTFGESFVLLDEEDRILFYPMLYTDKRGEEEAKEVLEIFGADYLFSSVGVLPQSMYSLYKLLWIRKNHPELYRKASRVMLICDYLGYRLTGERAIDYGLASRTGVFHMQRLDFDREILDRLDVKRQLFSEPKPAGSVVGRFKESVLRGAGIQNEVMLVLGSHDQICTTLGAGAIKNGDSADGMGTVECMTAVFDTQPQNVKMGLEGYPCVPFVEKGLFCTYILNYSNGSIVNWFRDGLLHGYKGDKADQFRYLEAGFTDTPSEVMVLPYFGGAATPYQDIHAKGAILNLTTKTTESEIYQSILESTSFEMRFNSENVRKYGIRIQETVASGGGANSKRWLQIKSDIQNIRIKTLRSSEGGLCGCAMLSALALRQVRSLEEARKIFVRYRDEFTPNRERHRRYDVPYRKYKKLYKTLKEFT